MYERQQRSFWAFDARAQNIETGVAYSISLMSELAWKKTDPLAIIAMTIFDNRHLQLTALGASFVVCTI